ncbi:MAG TPA: hypothetical protein VF784_14800 [Anaerolineales bacterium]
MRSFELARTDEAWHLPRKVFLLFLVVTASALGLVLLSRRGSSVPPVFFDILADASMGLLVGLAARFTLRDRHMLIQGLASAAISIIGLGILGYFTNWRSGLGPFRAGLVPVPWLAAQHITFMLPLEFGSSGMNLLDLVNMVIAVDASWIALRVWRQAPQGNGQSSSPSPRVRRPVRSHSRGTAAIPGAAAPRAPGSNGSGSRARVRRRGVDQAAAARPATAVRHTRSRPRRASVRQRRPAVHLAVHEEHRCPYCLQPVSRNDPRGTVECQICHTLHHKDCWDITGNCQVPHLTNI